MTRSGRDMQRHFTIQWNDLTGSFMVTDGDGPASLPVLPHPLDADLDAWEQHLRDHFTVDRGDDDLMGGHWSSEEARSWFVTEARRMEREVAKAIPRSQAVISVSAFPGVVPLRFFNDFGSWPLWTIGGDTGPEDFPMLSDGLRDDLIRWSERHETGDEHTKGHHDLLERLRIELGPLYELE